MYNDTKHLGEEITTTLPEQVRLSINRCNLPPAILGGLTFQRHPVDLHIDGIAELHHELWQDLEKVQEREQRALQFMDYMNAHFLLHEPEQAGYSPEQRRVRVKMDYRQLLRGWMFDPDNRESAVLKGWVESRFGLLPRWHKGAITGADDDIYLHYLQERTAGIYNTNALEAQLDLLYTYCQYELARQFPNRLHIRLYRGINPPIGAKPGEQKCVLLFNNLNACSSNVARADEFGSRVYSVDVPRSKVFYYSGLLPGLLKGEDEHIVIGGLYEVTRVTQNRSD